MKPRERTLLGKISGLVDREHVFLCEDAIEKDLVDGYDVETRRVFFSDIEMIAWHRQFSKIGLWFGGISLAGGVLLMLIISVSVNHSVTAADTSTVNWVSFWLCVAPNIPILLWFMRPYAYVTVYGKRNRATMCWHFRHAEARRVYEEVSQLVRDFQEHARQQLPQTVAVPVALAPPGAEHVGMEAGPVAHTLSAAPPPAESLDLMPAPVPGALPDQPAAPDPRTSA